MSRSCADSVIPDKKFSKEKNEQFKFEQKSIATDAFNELQELKIKEKIEKRKQNSCELTEKKQGTTIKKKSEHEKIEEEQLWDKLNTLNKEFRAIGNTKKQKILSKTILK